MDAVRKMADECSAEVSDIRRNADKRNPKPEYLSKMQRLENELLEAKTSSDLQSSIDRMWHIINDKALKDDDKLDIIYGELHKRKSDK